MGRQNSNGISVTEKQYAECLLFACFALRQFRNLGSHPASNALFEELRDWSPSGTPEDPEREALYKHVIMNAALDMGMDYRQTERNYGKPICLISSTHKGKRRFVGRLQEERRGPVFFLEVKGFGLGGLIGVGMPQYAPDATILFMAHLAYQYEEDSTFLPRLKTIASGCGTAWRAGRISMVHQEDIARELVNQQFL